MPIEITELIIRAKVEVSENAQPSSNNASANQSESAQTEALEKAVHEMLDILKRKKER